MKRFLFILLILFLFTGCSLFNLFGGGGGDEASTTVEVQNDGDVFLVKLNVSSKTVKGSDTGYVSGTYPRSAVSEAADYDTDRFIRDLNRNANKALEDYLADGSRSADRAAAKASGFREKDFKATEKFWSYVNKETKTDWRGNKYEVNIPDQIDAKNIFEGDHCLVYADTRLSDSLDNECNLIGQKFEQIYSKETGIIGDPLYYTYNSDFYVPCNQKIVILVSDLFGDATPNQSSGTVGYFYNGDLYKQSFLDNNLNTGLNQTNPDYIHSNGCEIFYIDSQFLKDETNKVYSTLVHEFNHMINYVVKTLNHMTNETSAKAISTYTSDMWFTEMLSMTTEDMFQQELGLSDNDSPKARLPFFGMGYYYGFKNWDDDDIDSAFIYANTYAFGAFLARNFGGVELIKEIAQNDYVNEEAITKALQKLMPNVTYKDEKTGLTKKIDFTYALRKFTMCIVNTSKNSAYTLNKDTVFKNGLGFKAVDIKNTISYQGKTYTVPFTFKPNQDGQVDIYPYGFTVHYVGHNLSSFTFNATNTSQLEYFVQ